ncbi:hypothetical protein RUND412_007048 [Rhizina undulata]
MVCYARPRISGQVSQAAPEASSSNTQNEITSPSNTKISDVPETAIPPSIEAEMEAFLQQPRGPIAANQVSEALQEVFTNSAQSFLHNISNLQSTLQKTQPPPPPLHPGEEPDDEPELLELQDFDTIEDLIDGCVAGLKAGVDNWGKELKGAIRPFYLIPMSRDVLEWIADQVRKFQSLFTNIWNWVLRAVGYALGLMKTAKFLTDFSMALSRIYRLLVNGRRLMRCLIKSGADGDRQAVLLRELSPV